MKNFFHILSLIIFLLMPSIAKAAPVAARGHPVTGTFWQSTQPISAASLPLPAGAATSANQLPDGHNVAITGTATVTQNTVSVIDAGNSSTSTLTSASTFTGTGVDITLYASVTVFIAASHDSAAAGISLELSSDNSNWDEKHTFLFDVSEHTTREFIIPTHAQFFRIVYTNGGTNQTHFRLQTILHTTPETGELHRLSSAEVPDALGELVKSVIMAQAAGTGNFIPLDATASGNLKVAIEEISDGLDIGAGNAGTETARISISTDDVNLSAIKTAIEAINNVTTTQADDLANSLNGLNTTSFMYVFDESTWDRLRGDAVNGMLVNLGTNNDVSITAGVPNNPIIEQGILELIGINEQVAAEQYSASVTITLAATSSGYIKKVCLFTSEDGSGVVFTPTGTLIIFDADPTITTADTSITMTERLTVVAQFDLATGGFQVDVNGGMSCQDTNEAFHSTGTLFATWFSATGETQWNSLAGDDEQLEFNFWYERKS